MFNTDHIYAQFGIHQYDKPEWLRVGDIGDTNITNQQITFIGTETNVDNQTIFNLMSAVKNHDFISIARTKNNRLKILFTSNHQGDSTNEFLQQFSFVINLLQNPTRQTHPINQGIL